MNSPYKHTFTKTSNSYEIGFSVIPEISWTIVLYKLLNDYPQKINKDTYPQNFKEQIVQKVLGEIFNTNIKSANQYAVIGANSVMNLIIPLTKGGKDSAFKNKQISYDHNWISEHKNAFQSAYGKSPFFEFYDYKLFKIFDSKPKFLWELHLQILQIFFPYLISHKYANLDYLNFDSNQLNHSQTTSIIQNPVWFDSIQTLIPEAVPDKLVFEIPEYSQVFDFKFGFQPRVCILDLLFNLGPQSCEYFKNL